MNDDFSDSIIEQDLLKQGDQEIGNVFKNEDNIIYECDICKKTFEKNKNLKRHRKLHFEESKIYKCNLCEKVYNRSDHLKRHMVVHSLDRKPYKCPYCILRYSYQSHLKQHIEKNHVIKADLNHYCAICQIHFTKKSQLIKHNYLHTGEKPFKCYYPFCDKSFFNKGKLNLHIQKIHNSDNQINNETFKSGNKINKNFDNKISKSNSNISNHISENISTCFENNDLSKMNSYDPNKLLNLVKEENEDFYDLNNENNNNNDYEMLLKLKRIDKIKDVEDLQYIDNLMDNKNNKINKCANKKKSRKFSSEVFAQKKEKSYYKCPIGNCIKTYISPFNLKVHIKTFHYKIQQYKCQVCEQLFSHKCSLNNHIIKTNHANTLLVNESNSQEGLNIELGDNLTSQEEHSKENIDLEKVENYEKNEEYNKDYNFDNLNDDNCRVILDSFDNDKNLGISNDLQVDKFELMMKNYPNINEEDNLLFKINPNFFSNCEL